MKKYLLLTLVILIIGCNGHKKEKTINSSLKSPIERIQEREQLSMKKEYSEIGQLVTTFDFKVKTENIKDFETGFIPWADLEAPEKDLPNLDKKDEIVIANKVVKVLIDYPLTNQYEFTLKSEKGFTRGQLLMEISKHYYFVYQEEEKTATVKTIPIPERKTMYNRNETNGKYGIWGHDIADMDLSEIGVYKTKSGEIILTLYIES